MWPFGDSGDGAAAQAETDRLLALSTPDLAVEVMAAFASDGLQTKSGHQQGAVQIATWLLSSYSKKVKYRQPVLGPTIEALGALEAAGLVTGRNFGSGSAKTYQATSLGESALADGTTGQHLNSGLA